MKAAKCSLVFLVLAACGGGGGSGGGGHGTSGASNPPPAAVLQTITVTPTDPTLVFGKTLQLVATGTYSDGTTRDLSATVTWGSTDPTTIPVSESGLVSTPKLGIATLVATLGTVQGDTTATVSGGAATESILHSFFGTLAADGDHASYLMQATDGNFYGTADNVVFKITADGVESILPVAAVPSSMIQAGDGNFYGVTGDAFVKITPDGVETVLHTFGTSPSDGSQPMGRVIQASDGNFYGTTASGGANQCVQVPVAGPNCGTVFKVTPAGAESILYSFGSSPSDGVTPSGSLIQASDGNFYGTTVDGGANNCGINPETEAHHCGTVFKLTPDGREAVLYSFNASPGDGYAPLGQLIQARDGDLYGTTGAGGGLPCAGFSGCGGTVFRITLDGIESILYRFPSTPSNLGVPSPVLFEGGDGNFYGTTLSAGPYENPGGIAYQITPDGVERTLYSFGASASDGYRPVFLLQARDGTFYGVTDSGGGERVIGGQTVEGSGTVFKLVL